MPKDSRPLPRRHAHIHLFSLGVAALLGCAAHELGHEPGTAAESSTAALAATSGPVQAECAHGLGCAPGISGAQSGTTLENGNTTVGYFDSGDYLRFDQLNLGPSSARLDTLALRMATTSTTGQFKVCSDLACGTSTTFATVTSVSTGSWTSWETRYVGLASGAYAAGQPQSLYLKGTSGTGITNFDWIEPKKKLWNDACDALTGWSSSSNAAVNTTTKKYGTGSIRLTNTSGSNHVTKLLDTSGYTSTNTKLSYFWRTTGTLEADDCLRVQYSTNGVSFTALDTACDDLAAFAQRSPTTALPKSSTLYLRFSASGGADATEYFYVDDVYVLGDPASCASAADCSDGNPCTDDVCSAGSCSNPANTASCNDGNACTTNDACSGGSCGGQAVACDDGNACTNDACSAATGCTFTPNSASCNDGDVCTVNDACSAGSCSGTIPADNDCDGIDDDCDLATDESYASTVTSCGVGACARSGSTSCVNGAVQSSCTPGTPAASDNTCNGIDDNCNGAVDESASCTLRIEAESRSGQNALSCSSAAGVCLENSNTTVGWFDANDWLRYSGVALNGRTQMSLRVAGSNNGGVLEVRADSTTGTLLGSYTMSSTGGWTTWATRTITLASLAGTHDLYLVGKSGSGILNIDWFELAAPPPPPGECTSAATCNDNNACTIDSCNASYCNHGFDTSACSCSTPPGYVPTNWGSTCTLPEVPINSGPLTTARAFPNLTFDDPVLLTHAGDGTNRIFMVEQGGLIKVFANSDSVTSATTFLNLTSLVAASASGGEMGLLGLAFAPDYKTSGRFYVNYTRSSPTRQTVVARYKVSSNPNVANTTGELLFTIDQPYENHNGGMMAFGADGYLYISSGDGGSANDPQGNGQKTTTLLGKMIRIDVSPATGYAIPASNPFAGSSGGKCSATASRTQSCPEIYAWGLRNPWRFSFDRADGKLWLGDVGQDAIEEINIIESGKNYGWNTMEGSGCRGGSSCNKTGLELPVATGTAGKYLEYDHSQGKAVIGGYVYRGSRVSSLYGKYLYADYVDRKVWVYQPGAPAPTTHTLLAPTGVSSFGEDESGDVFLLGYGNSGVVYRFTQQASTTFPASFPTTLSQTGCFDNLATMSPAKGVVPFEVNAPLWSDSALKSRFFVLPRGGKLGYSNTNRWSVPVGTILIKHFEIDQVEGDASSRTRLETRFIINQSDGVRGYSYRWNTAGTDATLIDAGETRALTLVRGGSSFAYTWKLPSRSDCNSCHTPASGGILGLETGQLNGDMQYPMECTARNQLQALEGFGLLDQALPAQPSSLVRYRNVTDASATITDRARAYLQTNCSNCHLPGGPVGTSMDLRYITTFQGTNTCDVVPTRTNLGLSDPRIIDPGFPGNSILYLRVTDTGSNRMPPLGTSLVHQDAAALLQSWITNLASCQ